MKKLFNLKTLALIMFCLLPVICMATGIDDVGTKVSGKMKEFLGPLKMIGLAIAGLGGVWFGIKILKGDNDAWEYAGKVLVGGCILASAAQIFDWFSSF